MKTITLQTKPFILAMSILLFASAPVLADDTEVYTGGNLTPSTARPNLVFIIDTSGSMNNDVPPPPVDIGTYDRTETYTGDCPAGRIYWKSDGQTSLPDCSSNQWIEVSANKCAASFTALGTGGSGLYEDTAARYRETTSTSRRGVTTTTYAWDDLSSSNHTEFVECQDDFGVHGETDATNPYPADGDNGGPWRADIGSTGGRRPRPLAVSWSSTGRTYTFYSANYINWRQSSTPATPPPVLSRLETVQAVFSDLVESISGVNIAVMRYSNNGQGGYFVMPMQELTDANRADYQAAVNAFTPNGSTPLAETLYESYLYYKGGIPKYGNVSSPDDNTDVPSPGVLDGTNYQSPIEYPCQKNFVILLTDGEPTSDTDADSNIRALPNFAATTGSSSCSGNCLDELADVMHTEDCSTLNDKQNVITYTIGFATSQPLLQATATKGGGVYKEATNATDLTDAFTDIIGDILSINTSFIAPAVSVNAFNRFNHREELYYALFRAEERPTWHGNVKRFRLYSPDANTAPEIVDAIGIAAIDTNTAFFKDSAQSFWTPGADAPDGADVERGGAASKLALPRTIYTYTGAAAPNNADLSNSSNALNDANSAITKDMLGDATMTDDRRLTLLEWAKGEDIKDEDTDGDTTDIRRYMGDLLHTKPVLVTYGGTDAAPDMTLFAGTNEGQLHAIDTDNGNEVFSFVPQELLPNLSIQYDNNSGTDHPYGLDGPLVAWVNDINDNGVIFTGGSATVDTGEHVYLYQGMRRGGSNYYALDVTHRATPKLKWTIKGGSDGTAGFEELGQTWSETTLAKIKLNGVDKVVIVFGGGYDTAEDGNETAQDDTIGRAIYMVDAETGAKVWEAGPSTSAGSPNLVLTDMTNSIPSDVTVIDTNFDGYKDRMYVGDMRGQVWRFDIDNDNNTGADNLVTGGVIANLNDGTIEGNRRFYYAPDASLSTNRRYINIAIGSGYRAHPLDLDIHDAFFVLRDENVFAPAVDGSGNPVYTSTAMGSLFDATSNILGEGTTEQVTTASAALESAGGYYISMSRADGSFDGEKVLAKSLTFGGYTIFTTYTPTAAADAAACSPSQGEARAYLINVSDGTPVSDATVSNTGDSTSDDGLVRSDRERDLVRGGIPPEPSIIFHENGPVLLVGTEDLGNPGAIRTPVKTNWHVVRP